MIEYIEDCISATDAAKSRTHRALTECERLGYPDVARNKLVLALSAFETILELLAEGGNLAYIHEHGMSVATPGSDTPKDAA